MKLRVAKKIMKAFETSGGARYSGHQVRRAYARYNKTASGKRYRQLCRSLWLSAEQFNAIEFTLDIFTIEHK